jgi:hypothetical protein
VASAGSKDQGGSVRVSVLIRRDADPDLFADLQGLPYGGMARMVMERLQASRNAAAVVRKQNEALEEQKSEFRAATDALARETSRLAWLAAQFEVLLAQSGSRLPNDAVVSASNLSGIAEARDGVTSLHGSVTAQHHALLTPEQSPRTEAAEIERAVTALPQPTTEITGAQLARIQAMAGAFE